MVKSLKKSFAGVMIAAFVFAGFATPAKAQTVAELQALVNQLMAKISAMSGGNASASSCTTFGLPGIMGVQQAVNQLGYAPALMADGANGPKTKAGVMWAQNKLGVSADGAWGMKTNAAYMAWLANCSTGNNNDGGSNNSGDLEGSFGTISDVSVLSQFNNEEVGEGDSEVKVLGFEVEAANDGDIMISSIKLNFDPAGNGSGDSDNLDDYIDSVTVWMGDKEVASADVSDFTENSNDTFTKTISLKNSIVRAEDTEKFYVSVDASGNLDSGDIDSDSWSLDVDNIRYEDGSGVVTTDVDSGDINNMNVAMSFVDFGTAADTDLKISTDSDSPEAGIVLVDDQDNTDNVSLLKGKIKLEGTSDVLIDQFPVTLTASGATNLAAVTSSVTLVIDGEEYTESVTSAYGVLAATVTFDNMDFDLSAGDTIEFEVKADINDIDAGSFDEGDTLKADVTSTNRTQMDVENEEGDALDTSSERHGSATGDYQEFRTQGITVDLVSTDAGSSNDTGALNDTGTFTIKFKVTAVGDDAYIATNTVLTNYPYTVDIGGSATTAGVSAVITNNTDTDLTSAYNWLIEEGQSETLTLTVSKVNSSGVANAGLTRANLTGIKWSDTDDNTPDNIYNSNMDDFHTDYISMN